MRGLTKKCWYSYTFLLQREVRWADSGNPAVPCFLFIDSSLIDSSPKLGPLPCLHTPTCCAGLGNSTAESGCVQPLCSTHSTS